MEAYISRAENQARGDVLTIVTTLAARVVSRESRHVAALRDVPTSAEARRSLGASLARILVDHGHRQTARLLDSSSSTSSRAEQPSCARATRRAQSGTDAVQRWLKKRELLKAHVHRDILALGDDVLKKFQAEVEAATQDVLRNEFAEKCRMFEAEKRFAINRNMEDVHARYEEYFASAQRELEERLRIEWADANAKRDKELQKAVVTTRLDTTRDVLRRMRSEAGRAIMSLRGDLELYHLAMREDMIAEFNKIMRRQYAKYDAEIKEAERKKIEELCIQRHELEIQKAIDIMYILYIERLHNDARIRITHEYFGERIKSLHKFIIKQEETINTMKKRIAEYECKNKMIRERIAAVTKEFQKFINFAFKAAPGHADFLLPLDLSDNKTSGMEKIISHNKRRNKTEIRIGRKLDDKI